MPIDDIDRSRFTLVVSLTSPGSATHIQHGVDGYPSDSMIQVFGTSSFNLQLEGSFDINLETNAASHFVSVSSAITENGFYTSRGLNTPGLNVVVNSVVGRVSVWVGR